MFSKFASIGLLVVAGIIVADILIHPTGTATAFNGASALEVPAVNGLLGSTTTSPSSVKG